MKLTHQIKTAVAFAFLAPIGTREALREYDPDLHSLVNETMANDGRVDWRLKS